MGLESLIQATVAPAREDYRERLKKVSGYETGGRKSFSMMPPDRRKSREATSAALRNSFKEIILKKYI